MREEKNMTTKHFDALATFIGKARRERGLFQGPEVEALCEFCEEMNENFRPARFRNMVKAVAEQSKEVENG